MYWTYLRRELAGRTKQTAIVAIGLAVAIALVIVVNALSAGVRDAQSEALSSVYGVGTDLTVTGAQTEPGQGGGGPRFDFGADDGTTQDGTTSLSQSRLLTDMRRGTLDGTTVTTIADLDGVGAATGALSLTNTTFSGEIPDRSTASGSPTEGGQDAGMGQPPAGGPGGGGGSAFGIDSFTVLGIDPAEGAQVPEGSTVLDISGTELRRRLREGLDIPEWFSFPEVVQQLRRTSPPRANQGFTVFFTGLSGSGKSTVANALMVKLMEMGGRPVSLLDGDVVRKHLSSELGFSKEHRDINIKRIGYVASEITKNGGIAICAPIAPYTATRRAVREMVEAGGAFVEVHVATPLEECERRDRKGLYKLAREGKIKEFTGISDPYEEPANPELRVDTTDIDVDSAAHQVLLKLESMGLIGLS